MPSPGKVQRCSREEIRSHFESSLSCLFVLRLASSAEPGRFMADEILLYCSILGRDVGRPFPVEISPSKTVGQLKKAIREEKRPELDHVAADKLDIWKASEPAQHKRPSVTSSGMFLQPHTPILEDNIADELEGVVDGRNIPDAQELRATRLLSGYFPDPLVAGKVHLVVQLPPSSEYQPSVTSYSVFGTRHDRFRI